MPLNAYTGLMGSGKTYEVVSSVILPALAKGRRVVTNIEGLDFEKIRLYLVATVADLNLGSLVLVSNEDVLKPDFFCTSQDDAAALVQGGDLVCLDEAWRFFGASVKMPPQAMVFLREHRHFSDSESGVTCDIVLMLQSISDLHRSVKSVVELSFKTHKLKAVGLNRRYRLDMFEGSDQKISRRANTWQKSYKSEIYDLYHSYAGGTGSEVAIDGRQNIFSDPALWFKGLGVLVLVGVAFGLLNYLYGRYRPSTATAAASVPAPAGAASAPAPGAVPAPPPPPAVSSSWRYVGKVSGFSGHRDIVASESGQLRASPVAFTGAGLARSGKVDGVPVYSWSGASGQTSLASGVVK